MPDIFDPRYGPYPNFGDGRFERAIKNFADSILEERKMVRAKFKLDSITNHAWGGTSFLFNAVWDDGTEENRRFNKATPSGQLTISVDNPSAIEKFKIGNSYYLDFTPAA